MSSFLRHTRKHSLDTHASTRTSTWTLAQNTHAHARTHTHTRTNLPPVPTRLFTSYTGGQQGFQAAAEEGQGSAAERGRAHHSSMEGERECARVHHVQGAGFAANKLELGWPPINESRVGL